MHLLEQILAGLMVYAVFSAFGVIGWVLWAMAGVRELRLPHIVTGKVLGLAVFASLAWWGAVAGVFPYSSNPATIGAWLTALGAAVWWLVWQTRRGRIIWPYIRELAWHELAAIVLLVCYLLFRSAFAQLESTEKFMDLALLNSAVRAESFPFSDFWRADLPINYYYFGYIPLALLLKLTGLAEPLGYNLLLGLWFILGLQLSYLLVRAVTRSHNAALLASALVMLGSNLHYTSCMASAALEGLALETHCPYPKATRVLEPPYTINEMPGYSFFLGDLHPHVISIPFFLTTLFILWQWTIMTRWRWSLGLLLVSSLAINAVVHAWDFMTLGALLGLLVLAGSIPEVHQNERPWLQVLTRRAAFLGLAVISPFVLYHPFFTKFASPVAGIGFAPSFLAMAELQGQAQYPSSALFLFLFWAGLVAPALAAAALLGWQALRTQGSLRFGCLLALTGLLLIAFTELFYFRDLFHIVNPPFFRANTVFKFGYHAWILLALAAAVLVHAAWSTRPVRALAILCATCFGASMLFPLEAFRQLARFAVPGSAGFQRLTLDGGRFIADRSPADQQAIQWLREHESGRPLLLEAFGESYSYAGRIGVFSGAINVANWPNHQWTWRFAYPEESQDWHTARGHIHDTGRAQVDRMGQKIRAIYESSNQADALRLARELGTQYLYVGQLERHTYPELDDDVLKALGEEVFLMDDSYLIRVDQSADLKQEERS